MAGRYSPRCALARRALEKSCSEAAVSASPTRLHRLDRAPPKVRADTSGDFRDARCALLATVTLFQSHPPPSPTIAHALALCISVLSAHRPRALLEAGPPLIGMLGVGSTRKRPAGRRLLGEGRSAEGWWARPSGSSPARPSSKSGAAICFDSLIRSALSAG